MLSWVFVKFTSFQLVRSSVLFTSCGHVKTQLRTDPHNVNLTDSQLSIHDKFNYYRCGIPPFNDPHDHAQKDIALLKNEENQESRVE